MGLTFIPPQLAGGATYISLSSQLGSGNVLLYDTCCQKTVHILAFKAVLLQNLAGVLSDTRVPVQTGVRGGTGQNGSGTGALILTAVPDERPPFLVVGVGAYLVEGQHRRDAGVRSVKDLRPLRLGFGGETTLEHPLERGPIVRAHLRGQVCGVQSQAWKKTRRLEDVGCQEPSLSKNMTKRRSSKNNMKYLWSKMGTGYI